MSGPLSKPPRAVLAEASVGKVAIASASSALNLSVLGASTLGTLGMVLAGYPLLGLAVLGIGALTYGTLIALDLFNEDFIRKVYGLDGNDAMTGGAIELVAPEEVSAAELRVLYIASKNKYSEIEAAISGIDDMLRDSLRGTRERCHGLLAEAGRLALRGSELARYRSGRQLAAVESEISGLIAQAQATADEKAAQTFMRAAEDKRQEYQTYQQIAGIYDRIKAQLSVINSSLDGVQAKIIKLRATDIKAAASVRASITENLAALTSDMQVLETSVSEILQEFHP